MKKEIMEKRGLKSIEYKNTKTNMHTLSPPPLKLAASTAAVESSTNTNSEGVLLHICEMVAFLAKIEIFDTIGINIGGDIDNLDLSCVP